MNKKRLFPRIALVKSHHPRDNNRNVMTNILPLSNLIGCSEKF